jgi:hypothetical protein
MLTAIAKKKILIIIRNLKFKTKMPAERKSLPAVKDLLQIGLDL